MSDVARVFVAMSGGVDSSVAAALLVEQGHDVTGVTMRLLDEDSPGGCCPSGSVRDARAVCDLLGVPHYTWDLREPFSRCVVGSFADAYAEGRTPNPCISCNDAVKFGVLLPKALAAGADALATGHYARVIERDGRAMLARGCDPAKDQSYFLYRMTAEQLRHVVFPVGEMTKPQVRERAAALSLPTAKRDESQEVCFVPGGDVRGFVRAKRPDAFAPGRVLDRSGQVIGRHEGVPGYTVGQRKGLPAGPEPRYVTAVDARGATLVTGSREDLAVTHLTVRDAAWNAEPGTHWASVRIRYRGDEVPGTIVTAEGGLEIDLDRPVEGAAAGQAVVCWDGEAVLGGGTLEEAR